MNNCHTVSTPRTHQLHAVSRVSAQTMQQQAQQESLYKPGMNAVAIETVQPSQSRFVTSLKRRLSAESDSWTTNAFKIAPHAGTGFKQRSNVATVNILLSKTNSINIGLHADKKHNVALQCISDSYRHKADRHVQCATDYSCIASK